jgi:hypothetical protein
MYLQPMGLLEKLYHLPILANNKKVKPKQMQLRKQPRNGTNVVILNIFLQRKSRKKLSISTQITT